MPGTGKRRIALQPPGPGWTWQDFVADAKKLTNPAIKQFGTAYVTPGTEDTVWHWEALLWEAGGQILNWAIGHMQDGKFLTVGVTG